MKRFSYFPLRTVASFGFEHFYCTAPPLPSSRNSNATGAMSDVDAKGQDTQVLYYFSTKAAQRGHNNPNPNPNPTLNRYQAVGLSLIVKAMKRYTDKTNERFI